MSRLSAMAALRAPTMATVIQKSWSPRGQTAGGEEGAGVGEGQRVDAVLHLDEAGEQREPWRSRRSPARPRGPAQAGGVGAASRSSPSTA